MPERCITQERVGPAAGLARRLSEPAVPAAGQEHAQQLTTGH